MDEPSFHAAIARTDGPLPAPRFAIYRNNVRAALTNALHVRYPMTARALGDSFPALAARYVAGNRPASPVLIDYGANFPTAVEELWVADVACLESAWWQAYHAAEAEPLAAATIAAQGPEALMRARFAFHPSLSLITTATPAAANWQALIDGAATTPAPQPQHILVFRPEAVVKVQILSADTWNFLSRLQRGAALGAAIEAAPSDFDLQGQMAYLLSGQFICGVHA